MRQRGLVVLFSNYEASLAVGRSGYAMGIVFRTFPQRSPAAERRLAMYYVGLDVHFKRSSVCILDCDGKLVKRLEVKGAWARLFEEVDRSVPRPFAVCYEASCGYGDLQDQLAKRADRVSVAHPGQLRLIFRAKKKNDRVDCTKLAKLLYLDEVPQVHVPDLDVRAWRGLINYRRRLVGRRAAV